MKEYIYNLGAAVTNAKLLKEQINASVGGFVEFHRDTTDALHIVFNNELSAPSKNALDTIVENHDHTQLTAEQQAVADEENTRSTTRTAIRNAAQSAVGVSYADLTAGQRNAIIACIAFKLGALDKDGNVRPLAEWLV